MSNTHWQNHSRTLFVALLLAGCFFTRPAVARVGDVCGSDDDCSSNESCGLTEQCEEDEVVSTACSDSSPCPEGQSCNPIGACVECLTDADCDAGESCSSSGVCETPAPAASAPIETPVYTPRPFATPLLSIPIPGVEFTPAFLKEGKVTVNFLGEYVAGIYNYLIGISITIAIVMIMIGGLQYVLSAGTGNVKKAKERIKNAVVGLVLLLSVYVILFTVNPQLLVFDPLGLTYLQRNEATYLTITQNLAACKDLKDSVKPCQNFTFKAPSGWNERLTKAVLDAASKKGVDPLLLATHIVKETGPKATTYGRGRGPCGEIGPVQFMPATFDETAKREGLTMPQCCLSIARKKGEPNGCAEGIKEWPPADVPDNPCKPGSCSNCQKAASSCIDYFDTNTANGLENAVLFQASLIKKNLSQVSGDYAMAICAYNGSGANAAAYGQDGARKYSELCRASGGTQ